jgi:PAS domain S-box-containing protein
LQPTLQSLIAGDPFVQAAYVTDERGVIREVALNATAALNSADFVGLDQSSQPHYRAARAKGLPQWSETFLSILTSRITVVLAIPIGPQALMIELSLDELSGALKEMGRTDEITAIVLDRNGRVIGHPRIEAARQQESLAHLPLVAQAGAGPDGVGGRVVLDGADFLAQMLPVRPTGWHVLVAESVHSVLAPLRSLAWILAFCLLATFVGASALAWWFARRAGQEVSLLATAARPAVGATPQSAAPPFETAEFAQIWQRLNTLFGEVRDRELQAQTARRELQAVLDAATEVAIVAADLAGTVRLFSRGASKLLGYAEADVVGRATPMLWHDARQVAERGAALGRALGRPIEGIEVIFAIPRQAGYEVRDWTYVRDDGSPLAVSLAVTGIRNGEGDLTGFLGVAIDVTERHKAAALEVARRAAEAGSQAKSEFLSRMSHELRSPLNAMLGYAQLMEIDAREPPTEKQRARLQQVQRAGWHLVELIDEVLDLARIESGRMQISLVAVDVAEAVERAVELVAPQMQQHGVSLSVRSVGTTGDACAGVVMADATRLIQVLVNLLSNAAKYNRPQGRVELECESQSDERVALRVRDTGRGMSAAQLAQLYEPFNRLGRETSGIDGTGIGLVITRRLVQLMDGELQVASSLGEGTEFTVLLPRAAGGAAAPAGATAVVPPVPLESAPRARVLYIEDNAVNATLMRQILRERPRVELTIAATAGDGLAQLRAEPTDLLLLDLHLPDASGFDVLLTLAADESLRAVPVIVVSADATQHQIEASLRHGARGYLTKPLNIVETLAQIDRILAEAVEPERAARGGVRRHD